MNMKLIKNTENISKEKITLFCLPFAGGGASAYNQWAKKMQGKVTVCPVQLPGREEQIMEKPYIDMSVMLDDLEEAVRKVVYGPVSYTHLDVYKRQILDAQWELFIVIRKIVTMMKLNLQLLKEIPYLEI